MYYGDFNTCAPMAKILSEALFYYQLEPVEIFEALLKTDPCVNPWGRELAGRRLQVRHFRDNFDLKLIVIRIPGNLGELYATAVVVLP